MDTRYTTEEVREWKDIPVLGTEIHPECDESKLRVVLLEPESVERTPGLPPPNFQVTRADLVRICRQILREIDPTPEEEILQALGRIEGLLK